MAAAISASMAAAVRPSSVAFLARRRPKWVFSSVANCSSSSSSSTPKTRKLVLYSKPGCCLCDGLKEKLQAAFLLSGPDSLHDVVLQVRDITTNPDWEKAYQYEIPVLAKENSDGTEEILPRLSPRLRVELIQKNSFVLLPLFSLIKVSPFLTPRRRRTSSFDCSINLDGSKRYMLCFMHGALYISLFYDFDISLTNFLFLIDFRICGASQMTLLLLLLPGWK
ncbi:PREDICTED: uncharacterized protein LOC104817239 isoform X3 [Tarenaya hassleriana]|uniref:uncharacterized protein LOC104817239 isoform X3 n=1 Tax=Tarenaya hassleriana TaxID=28532 RepID=UPI00053CA363|nr:PREDICTED: uncharacterized protein LOC104817239 isoform X3 [Tarenaya hassleriana]